MPQVWPLKDQKRTKKRKRWGRELFHHVDQSSRKTRGGFILEILEHRLCMCPVTFQKAPPLKWTLKKLNHLKYNLLKMTHVVGEFDSMTQELSGWAVLSDTMRDWKSLKVKPLLS